MAANVVVYKGAFVPWPKKPPRPVGMPVEGGASPPTDQIVPILNYCNELEVRQASAKLFILVFVLPD